MTVSDTFSAVIGIKVGAVDERTVGARVAASTFGSVSSFSVVTGGGSFVGGGGDSFSLRFSSVAGSLSTEKMLVNRLK